MHTHKYLHPYRRIAYIRTLNSHMYVNIPINLHISTFPFITYILPYTHIHNYIQTYR